jgi:predicted SAM-dependent methyltransferase
MSNSETKSPPAGWDVPFFELTSQVTRAAGRQLPLRNLRWYRQFLGRPAPGFLIEHQLDALPLEEQLDILAFCRTFLAPGGILRMSGADANHTCPGYRELLTRRGSTPAHDAEARLAMLRRLGFEPRLIEGFTRGGDFVQEEPDFAGLGRIRRSSRLDRRHADPELRMSSVIIDARRRDAPVIDPDWPERIYAIGDSHVRFLAGRDEVSTRRNDGRINWYENCTARFTGLHVGPGLAHNANRPGSRTQSFEKIMRVLDGPHRAIPAGARLLFSFGEIDCRYHVCRLSEAKGMPVEAIVDDICAAYIGLLDRVAALGYRPGAWGPVAPTWVTFYGDPENPVHGAYEQRLAATRRFNQVMGDLCAQRGFPYLTLTEKLLDDAGGTDRRWYTDDIHLSQYARALLYPVLPPIEPMPEGE